MKTPTGNSHERASGRINLNEDRMDRNGEG